MSKYGIEIGFEEEYRLDSSGKIPHPLEDGGSRHP
jgi:hypothetical protein